MHVHCRTELGRLLLTTVDLDWMLHPGDDRRHLDGAHDGIAD
jgi:hypothetical protein